MPQKPVAVGWLPRDTSAQEMVRQMQRLVENAYIDPRVRGVGTDIVRFRVPRDYVAAAKAIREYLAAHIRFLRDPEGRELGHTPQLMLKTIREYGITNVDCDDAAILAAALGRSVGLRARFVLLGFITPDAPLAHVYTELAGPAMNAPWIEQDVTRSQREIPFDMISRRVIVPARVQLRPSLGQQLASLMVR